MNIILIGFMGSGKSAVGHQLASGLKMNFVDTDALVEKTAGQKISQIFADKGEAFFRSLETEVLKTLVDYDNFVIATGGGIVLKEENVKILKELGPVVLLWAKPETIYNRVKDQAHRPLLNVADPLAEIKKILTNRELKYKEAADFTVATSKLTVDQVVKEIVEQYGKNKG